MTTTRWLLLGLVIGFTSASATSCGAPKQCTAASCPAGCCDASGTCQAASQSACGNAGNACVQCQLGQNCQLGICVGNGGTGGFGMTGGGNGTTGGGSGTTAGGNGTTGGGNGTTGGGTGTPDPLCTSLETQTNAWFDGKSECAYQANGGTVRIGKPSNVASQCTAALPSCSVSDKTAIQTWADCIGSATECSTGDEELAIGEYTQCGATAAGQISAACTAAFQNSGTGGGNGTTGGGSGTPGGGNGTTGGGVGTSGGGVGTTGGGSGTTGGGSGTTGGGSGTTGGGSGTSNVCTSLGNASTVFFAGRSSCGSVSASQFSFSNCSAVLSQCTSNDQSQLNTFAGCIDNVPCTTGNDSTALSNFFGCYESMSLTSACQSAIQGSGTGGGSGTTGGGSGTTGGGTGTTGGGTGTTGGGTGNCTPINLGTFAAGTGGAGLTIYMANPLGSQIGTSLNDFAQLRFTSTSTGSATFSATGLNISTAPRCLLVGQDADASTGVASVVYAANSGTINVSGASPVTGPLNATLSNVTLVPGTLDSQGNFTVVSGTCLSVASATISASGPPAVPSGWLCDNSWYGDGDCDCGCGVKDMDCGGTTSTSQCAFCTRCNSGGTSPTACASFVNPNNTTQCLP